MIRGLGFVPRLALLPLVVLGCRGEAAKAGGTSSAPAAPTTSAALENPETGPSASERPSEEELSIARSMGSELPLGTYDRKSDPKFEKLTEKLAAWAKKHEAQVSVAVLDPDEKTFLATNGADEPRNPASNQKLFTAAAALAKLGGGFRFRTEIRGNIDDEGHAEEIALVGGGAPDFTTSDLYRLGRALTHLGLASVGSVVVDQSKFSGSPWPPAYEQQPNEWAAFRAPVSAMAINKNTVTLEVVPTKVDEAARVFFDPPGFMESATTLAKCATGKDDKVTWELAPSKDRARLVSKVAGSIGVESGRRRYTRRVDEPLLLPALAFDEVLRGFGVKISGKPKVGSASGEVLLNLDSDPLRTLVFDLGKESDNFSAETLLIALSAAKAKEKGSERTPWSTENGLEVLREFLGGILPSDVAKSLVFKNGSGLFDANRVTARSLALLLAEMKRRPEIYPEFVSQLAIGGIDGTLAKRFKEKRGRVRAKTGTLKDAIALSGYVDRGEGKSPLVFSVLLNGSPKAMIGGREALDQFVISLVD